MLGRALYVKHVSRQNPNGFYPEQKKVAVPEFKGLVMGRKKSVAEPEFEQAWQSIVYLTCLQIEHK